MKLIFDVGCNEGKFCQKSMGDHPDAHVIAIDANTKFKQVYENIPKVTFVNMLVSTTNGEFAKFYMDHISTGISTASDDWMNQSRFAKGSKYISNPNPNWSRSPVYVETITLDKLIETYGSPDFIKIDVEGYELEVLSGLTKKQHIIAFEWTEEFKDKLLKCISYLSKIGYSEFGMVGFFEEGNIFEHTTHSSEGDPHMKGPDEYVSLDVILETIEKVCNPERRINYGMFFVK